MAAIQVLDTTVGLGELQVSRNLNEILVIYGLGSCVGVSMYDASAQVGGLLHAVLPQHPVGAAPWPAKYVDTGIAALVQELSKQGAQTRRLVVRLAGGASLFANAAFKPLPNIGERNIAMAVEVLAKLRLPITSQAVGGQVGRTLRLYLATGRMTVRSLGQAEHEF